MRQFVFFNDTATTEIYTLSLHDALPIWSRTVGVGDAGRREQVEEAVLLGVGAADGVVQPGRGLEGQREVAAGDHERGEDRKSTRLNSSHANISYAVFCLKKKKSSRSHLE